MWLADTSIKRPVFATMVIAALVIFGVVSYPGIGVDLFPKVDFPIVNITTTLKGASPEIIDIDVTDKIEEAVNTINGVKTINSSSTEGVSTVSVEFVLERDIDLAVQDVREKISTIRSKLPRDIDEPVIEKVDPDATPVLWLALTGEKSPRELSTYADEVLKEQLQKISGVGAIRLAGLRLRQVRIWLDSDRLTAYQITAHDVIRALQRESIELPSGRIESNTKEYSIKVKGEFLRVQEFNDLIVGYNKGAPIRLRDIGRAEDGIEEKRSIARFNGLPAVGMGIQKQSGTNTVEVIDRIKKELVNIKKSLPSGMKLETSFDQSTFIKLSINEVQHHLIYGGVLAALAVLLFLKSTRITLISALAIPTSIIATFAIMKLFNFTFNNMTMLALSLSVGILIDDAIIVIENIHRHIEEGMPPRKAASFATSEIGLAVVATTLAIVAIFLPVAFMKGLVGRFFVQFALTVVFAVMVSLFVSFTLTPMLASRYLRSQKTEHRKQRNTLIDKFSGRFEKVYKKTEYLYRELLRIALNHRAKVLIIAAGIFIFSLLITKFLGKEFLPPEDQSRFIARLQAPSDYSVEEVDRMFKKAEDIIRSLPEDRANPGDIGKIYVRSKDGRLVELSNIVKVQEAGGPSAINRVDRQRAIFLFANLEIKPLGQAKAELDAISAKTLPSDYSGIYKGAAEMMGESFYYLMFALLLGIILAYMILASQFESFVHPITVLLSMPFSFIGAFGALLVTGKTLNIFSFIGLILLMGLVKKNAILLVDYTNTLRARGMERKEAILEAGPVRLRPILMTTFAMVFGMMPIAIGIGEGAETRAPMAIATIGGLLTSLFLTLVVAPVAYDLFDDLQDKFKKRSKATEVKT